jgi:hypothetical protein
MNKIYECVIKANPYLVNNTVQHFQKNLSIYNWHIKTGTVIFAGKQMHFFIFAPLKGTMPIF